MSEMNDDKADGKKASCRALAHQEIHKLVGDLISLAPVFVGPFFSASF